jgi:hypothetical protein
MELFSRGSKSLLMSTNSWETTQCLLPRKLLMVISQVRYDSSTRFGCCVLTAVAHSVSTAGTFAPNDFLNAQKFKREGTTQVSQSWSQQTTQRGGCLMVMLGW